MSFIELFPFIGLTVISIIIFGRVLYLKKLKIKVRSRTAKKGITKYLLYPVFLVIMHLWIFESGRSILHIHIVPKPLSKTLADNMILNISGLILIFISFILLGTTVVHFKKSLRFGMHSNNLGKLIKTGIFSVTRNPFFISLELYFIGSALILPSPFIIAYAIVAIVVIHFFILKEEKFLKKNYGDEYIEYSKRVRRYI